MPIRKPIEDLEFLDRVDRLWRNGSTQTEIAQAEGSSGSSGLHIRLARLGFRLGRQGGGPRLVTTLEGRDYADMRSRGEIAPREEAVPA
jgi:hypothetical protein